MKISAISILIAVFGLLNLSAYSKPRHAALLTDDYGIITLADFEFPEQLSPESHFPDNEFENYWQCLKPEKYLLDCENIGPLYPGDEDEFAQSTFWIQAGGKIYDFGTRRNWDMEFCKNMVSDISKIITNEPVVCVYASYVGSTTKGSDWIIDRVKTTNGEWSWFGKSDEE